MKYRSLRALAVFAFLLPWAAPLAAIHVGAGLYYFSPSEDDFDGNFGFAVRTGTEIGSHAIDFEIGFSNFDGKVELINDDFEVGGTGSDADEFLEFELEGDMIPILINYSWRFNPLAESDVSIYLTGTAGFTYFEADLRRLGEQTRRNTEVALTFGVGSGLAVPIAEQMTLLAGYRALWIDELEFDEDTVSVDIIHRLEISLLYRF